MTTIREIGEHLERLAPAHLAEDWDNVGLLVGDGDREAGRVMTCLTVTPSTAQEAIERSADLIVTHHPLPFRSLKRLTVETTVGRLLWELIGNQISIYSPHTAWDSAKTGINQRLAEGLGLTDVRPLEPLPDEPDGLGSGRFGVLANPKPLKEFIEATKSFLSLEGLQFVGDENHQIQRVAVACGSAGQFLSAAQRHGCDVLLTGETSFHSCLEAASLGICLVLPGHFASEHFSLTCLAQALSKQFSELDVWSSERESDPLRWK